MRKYVLSVSRKRYYVMLVYNFSQQEIYWSYLGVRGHNVSYLLSDNKTKKT